MDDKNKKGSLKTLLGVGAGIFVLALIFGSNGSSTPTPQVQSSSYTASAVQAQSASQTYTSPAPVQQAPNNNLSNNNSYTNVDNNTVHSPAYSENGSIPSGASARCGDGTYSFSQHHSGTCSHHGGVMSWLD